MGKKGVSYKKLDPETMKELTGFIIEHLREEESKLMKIRYDRKRANTKLLLRNYRSLVDHCDSAVYNATHVDDDVDLADILDMMCESNRESFRVESIRESTVRTRLIIDHVNVMLEMYRVFCERSTKDEDRRRYRIITAMYISDNVKTLDEIAADENIDKSTVYRDIDTAVERLTALIFGIDGLYFLKK